MGGNGFNRRGAVAVISVRQAFSVLLKSPSPLEMNSFDSVTCRVGVKTLIDTCSTQWRLYATKSSVYLLGIAALS